MLDPRCPHQPAKAMQHLMPAPPHTHTLTMRSKFDNRLKEFAERWEVDRYLAATGYLPPTVKPFFVALPKVRATCLLCPQQPLLLAYDQRAACNAACGSR